MTGDLTIRGTKKSISFPAKIALDGSFSLNAEFSINRKDFGIVYDGKADDLIRDGVVLKLALKSALPWRSLQNAVARDLAASRSSPVDKVKRLC